MGNQSVVCFTLSYRLDGYISSCHNHFYVPSSSNWRCTDEQVNQYFDDRYGGYESIDFNTDMDIFISLILDTVFPQLIPHPRLVPQCGTIQIQTTLNSMFILIVTHPRIIPHDSVKNRILLLKSLNSLLNKAQSGPNKLSSKLPCSKPTAHTINSNCSSSLTCLYVCSRIGSMLEQVRNLVVIKISVVTIAVALFIL